MAEKRGFASVEEHDEAICEGWTRIVTKRDQVWVLGDLALSDWRRALEVVAKLPGDKHLVLGNHDVGHPLAKNYKPFSPRLYLEVFTTVQTMATRKIKGERVMLSHFPYDGDHTFENRFMQSRLRDEGAWLLHGHTHSNTILNNDHPKEIHVGVDAWSLMPAPLGAIEMLI